MSLKYATSDALGKMHDRKSRSSNHKQAQPPEGRMHPQSAGVIFMCDKQ